MRLGKMKTLLSVTIVLFAGSYLLGAFAHVDGALYVSFALLVPLLVVSIFTVKGQTKIIGLILLVSGVLMLIVSDASLGVWASAVWDNAYLLVLFIAVPLVGIPIRIGGYDKVLQGLLSRLATSRSRFYGVVSTVAGALGALISIAAVPLTHEAVHGDARSGDRKLLGTSLSRGFATCMVWAPTSATIALVLQLTGANWVTMMPCAITCVLVMEAIGCMQWIKDDGIDCKKMSCTESFNSSTPRQLSSAIMYILIFVAIVVVLGLFSSQKMIIVVALASVIAPVVWGLFSGEAKTYVEDIKVDYFAKKVPKLKGQILLFTAAGVFAKGIQCSGVGAFLVDLVVGVTGSSFALLSVVIIVLVVATSMMGIHPVAMVSALGAALALSGLDVTPEALALLLSASWSLGNVVCPASANTIAVSGLIGSKPLDASIKWNLSYVIASSLAVILLVNVFAGFGML